MADQKSTQTDNTAQSILAELSKLQAELGETERTRATNKSEVKKIEERLRSLGEEVMKKVSKLVCTCFEGKGRKERERWGKERERERGRGRKEKGRERRERKREKGEYF
jgi:GTPase involved in cell partitioning and DNA repair